MNCSQFEVAVSQVYLAGDAVASWSLTQELAGSNPFTLVTNNLSLNSLNSVKLFEENADVYQLMVYSSAECSIYNSEYFSFSLFFSWIIHSTILYKLQ